MKTGVIWTPEMSLPTSATWHRHIPEDIILHSYHCGNIKSYIVVLYGKLITFDKTTACHLYLHGNTYTQQWRYHCKRLYSLSFIRYILAVNQGDSLSFTPKMEAIWSSEMSIPTTTTRHHHIPGQHFTLLQVSKFFKNEKAQFQVALHRCLNIYALYYVDEFLLFKNCMYLQYWCVSIWNIWMSYMKTLF
jgi:hypothetical protein